MTDRRNLLLRAAARRARKANLDAFLVTGRSDMLYLSGYYAEGAKLVIPAEGKAVYFIDGMNEALGRGKLEGLALEDIAAGPVNLMVREYLRGRRFRKVGLNESRISVLELKALEGRGSVGFRHFPSLLEDMRLVKRDFELPFIRKAARETVKIWKEIRKNVEPGMTEKDIADMVNVLIRALGYGNAFDPVVAVGENTAYPHAVPGRRRWMEGEHFLVDFGVRVEGYCSDLTRTYSKGRINRKIAGFRKKVRAAHDLAISMIKPGVNTAKLSETVYKYFNINNIPKELILHGLGHGVGLDIHERPFFGKGRGERLRKGMVITVEPGLYEPGLGGVRLEDTVLVTDKGCEVLTR